jgi:hypothetical protein
MVLAEGRATDHPLVATDQSMTFDHAIVAAHPRLTAVKDSRSCGQTINASRGPSDARRRTPNAGADLGEWMMETAQVERARADPTAIRADDLRERFAHRCATAANLVRRPGTRSRGGARPDRAARGVRLVTITDPAGWETRLVLRAIDDLADGFADGVWFVALASVRDPVLVASSIAHTLGVRDVGGRPVEAGNRGVSARTVGALGPRQFRAGAGRRSARHRLLSSCPKSQGAGSRAAPCCASPVSTTSPCRR